MSAETADVARFGHLSRDAGRAELRFRRIATFAVGLSIGGYLFADLATIRAQADQFASAWSVFAIVGQAIGAVAFLVLPWFASARVLRIAAISFAGFGVLILALAIPAALHPPITGGVPWPMLVKTDYALAAMLGLPTVAAWCAVGAIELLAAFVDGMLSVHDNTLTVAENLVASLSVAALLAFVLQVVFRIGHQLDLAEAGAVLALRREAAESARASERRRIELLTHDAVLSTLRAASLGLGSATTSPQSMAKAALERLDAQVEDGHAILGEDLADKLRSRVARIAPDATVTVSVEIGAQLPADAVSALLESSEEALRNSVAYAGESALLRVDLQVKEAGVTIVLSDNGVGFAPAEVEPHRLGIARSILGRMEATAGGSASVTSQPGAGATITLRWQR